MTYYLYICCVFGEGTNMVFMSADKNELSFVMYKVVFCCKHIFML